MLIIRLFIITLFVILLAGLPKQVSAERTPYRSAGWVATDLNGNIPYINLTGCQATDSIYCSRSNTTGGSNLYLSSFGTLADFGIPQNAVIRKIYIKVTGKEY